MSFERPRLRQAGYQSSAAVKSAKSGREQQIQDRGATQTFAPHYAFVERLQKAPIERRPIL
jgi:hypothetical protein